MPCGVCKLEFADKSLRGDKELVLAAVERHGLSLADADVALQNDRDVPMSGRGWCPMGSAVCKVWYRVGNVVVCQVNHFTSAVPFLPEPEEGCKPWCS